jgi:hypothetical protein
MSTGKLCLFISLCAFAQQKQVKDAGEYKLYDAVAKDFAAKDYSKIIPDLDAWKRAYPDSDYKIDRECLYVQAYGESNQPAKSVDTAAALIASGAKLDSPNLLRVLFTTVTAIRRIDAPNEDKIAFAESAAHRLIEFENPDNVGAAAWAQASKDLREAATDALLYVHISRSAAARSRNDCLSAEAAANRAIEIYPESIQAAWYLAMAELCLQKTDPKRASFAIYEFARAAAIDPAKGKADAKWQDQVAKPNLVKIYNQYHGEDAKGLAELKTAALASPVPPADFRIQSDAELKQQKQAEFETKNPEIALWTRIKAQLSGPDGESYFISGLKDSALPRLRGVLVEAKPVCRPTELMVAVRMPGNTEIPPAEIALKLDKPLEGMAEKGAEFGFEGVPSAFAPSPFQLTIRVEAQRIDGLEVHACTARKK